MPAMGAGGDVGGGALTRVYVSAHFGKSLFWCSSELIFAFFLTDVAGLSGWQMAAIMAIGLAANGLIDLVIGQRLSRGGVTLAAAGRTQLVGARASAIALLLLFGTGFVPVEARAAYALTAMLAFRLTYALYDVPQNAMLSLGTVDAAGRARVSALRLSCSGAASVAVAAAIAGIFAFVDPADHRVAFGGFAILFALIAWSTAHLLRAATRPFGERPDTAASHTGSSGRSETFSLPVLMLVMLLTSIAISTFTKLEPYYVSALSRDGGGAAMLMVAASLGFAGCQPFWLGLRRKDDDVVGFAAPLLLLIVSLALFGLLAPLGMYVQLIGAFLFGIANGGTGLAMWAAYANSVSARAGSQETLAFGAFTGVAKFGLALSAVLVGGTVALTGDVIKETGFKEAGHLLVAMVPIPIGFIAAGMGILWLARPGGEPISFLRLRKSVSGEE